MKTLIKRNLLSVFAVLLALGTMSFKLSFTPTTFHYLGSGAFNEASNWAIGSAGTGECYTSGSKPCEIQVEAEDLEELDLYFEEMTTTDVENLNPSSRKP